MREVIPTASADAFLVGGCIDGDGSTAAGSQCDTPAVGEPYVLPIASEYVLGGVKAKAKTDEMTQEVGVDDSGKLWSLPGGGGGGSVVVDTALSDTSKNPVENKAIKKYVDDLADQIGPLLGDKSLGVTGASVGQIIEVEAVDEGGRPTKWKAVDKPAGQKVTTYKDPKSIPFANGMQLVMYASGNTDVSMTIGAATITKQIRADVIWGMMLQTSPRSGSFILPSGTRDYMAYGSTMTPTEVKINSSNKGVSLVINVVGG